MSFCHSLHHPPSPQKNKLHPTKPLFFTLIINPNIKWPTRRSEPSPLQGLTKSWRALRAHLHLQRLQGDSGDTAGSTKTTGNRSHHLWSFWFFDPPWNDNKDGPQLPPFSTIVRWVVPLGLLQRLLVRRLRIFLQPLWQVVKPRWGTTTDGIQSCQNGSPVYVPVLGCTAPPWEEDSDNHGKMEMMSCFFCYSLL